MSMENEYEIKKEREKTKRAGYILWIVFWIAFFSSCSVIRITEIVVLNKN